MSSPATTDRLRILLLGYIVRGPMGGMSWHHLNYLLGMRELGHDVYFLEHSEDHAWTCYDPRDHTTGADPGYGLRYLADALLLLGFEDRWAYHHGLTDRWYGPWAGRIDELCAGADLLINVSGVNPLRPWLLRVPRRIYVDTDPAFTQLHILHHPDRRAFVEQHTEFFSFGANVGRPESRMPDDGLPWRPTRQPVALTAWPPVQGQPGGRFTTIMQWESYGAGTRDGVRYGMKSDSFDIIMDLPRRAGEATFELVLLGDAAPRSRLVERGWGIVDPRDAVPDPFAYRHYLQRSKAEFSVAKHGYAVSRCGWFSERSANYLASGRPVIVQDTGFSDWLETGRGVLTFATLEEAAEAVHAVNADYPAHCRAAREVAEAYFDARRVLGALIDQVFAGDRGGRAHAPDAAPAPRPTVTNQGGA